MNPGSEIIDVGVRCMCTRCRTVCRILGISRRHGSNDVNTAGLSPFFTISSTQLCNALSYFRQSKLLVFPSALLLHPPSLWWCMSKAARNCIRRAFPLLDLNILAFLVLPFLLKILSLLSLYRPHTYPRVTLTSVMSPFLYLIVECLYVLFFSSRH